MKNWVMFILLMLSGFKGVAQAGPGGVYYFWPQDTLTHKFSFRGSVYLRGFYENKIYSTAQKFLAKHIDKSDTAKINTNDTISTTWALGSFPVTIDQLGDKGVGFVTYRVTIECFDNGYFYTITDIEHSSTQINGAIGGALERDKASSGGLSMPKKYWDGVKEKVYYHIQNVIEHLKEYMDGQVRLAAS